MMKSVIFVVAIACLAAISQARSVMHGRHLLDSDVLYNSLLLTYTSTARRLPGNPSCDDLVGAKSGGTAILPGITSLESFKIDPVNSNTPLSFDDTSVDGPGTEGTTASPGSITITEFTAKDGEPDDMINLTGFDTGFTVAALIVKGSNQANIYVNPDGVGPYVTPRGAISHVDFCIVPCTTQKYYTYEGEFCPGNEPAGSYFAECDPDEPPAEK